MDALLQDIRYAARTLRANPTFTVIAVLCLSLGIATNTTLFSCFDAIVLRPFPARDPSQLVELSDWNPKNNNRFGISWLNLADWREQTKSFTGIGAYSGRSLAITEGEEPARLNGMMVTWNLFPLLGIQPQLGRGFREDEDKPGAPGTILLSDGVWHRLFGGDSSVINRVVSINNEPRTVIGIMPPEFRFPQNADAWIPLAPLAYQDKRELRFYDAIGRMKPGVTLAQANKELTDFTTRLYTKYDLKPEGVVGQARVMADAFLPNDI
ncbi:MAG TPA: ABC transporter permease [Gemmatimonadaceae bacterium]